MKKVISAVLLIFCITLCACGKPMDMSDSEYQLGITAYETMTDYLGGKISADTADDKLDYIYDRLDAEYETTGSTKSLLLSSYILSFQINMEPFYDAEKLNEAYNEFKKKIGK